MGKVTVIACGPAVNESERKAVEGLKTRLISSEPFADEWLLLTNLPFSASHQRQSDEIDIVAIGPPGLRIIEVKHWTAAWVRKNKALVEQEADKVTNKARRMGTSRRKKVPGLGRVEGVFLLTEAASRVKGLDDPVRGVPFCTLKAWRDAVGFGLPKVLSFQQVRTLRRELTPASSIASDGTLKRFSGYTNLQLQTPSEQRFHRVYKSVHSSRRDQVILHLYDLSADESPKAEAKARREFEALHRLQQHSWAPRIVDSFQPAPGYPGEISFFTMVDPEAPSIERRAGDGSWDANSRLNFALSAVHALSELHGAGTDDAPMIHRNLTPTSILVKHDNSPILTGFNYARVPSDITIASNAPQDGSDALAPEVQIQGLGAADLRSDVYSLCASLAVLFEKNEDAGSCEAMKMLGEGMAEEPADRADLSALESSLAQLLGESAPHPPVPSARFWTEDQIIEFDGRDYRIISRLGSGGIGTAFKVVEIDRATNNDLGAFVAKVIGDEREGKRVLNAYRSVRPCLPRHPAFSAIYQVATEWQDNNFSALMTWIEGEPLSEYAGMLPLLAEDLQEESDEALACRWLRTACEGLDILHRNGFIHGDLSPRNMIVCDADLVLTDYDCVTRIGTPRVAPATIPYSSMSFNTEDDATPADDFYALAASFFHMLFERPPFEHDGTLVKERGLNWEGVDENSYPLLAGFLNQATNPKNELRYKTAAEAIADLQPKIQEDSIAKQGVQNATEATVHLGATDESADQKTSNEARHENEVEWLKSLLQSYPGSRWGNSETRGLDSDFAAGTYIETDLERSLYKDIVERKISLVILCGNAGDGKTALLQHLAERLGIEKQTSATRILKGKMTDGRTIRMNLDGSASWRDRSADELLNECLGPFLDGPNQNSALLLAINDGRLLEWIEDIERDRRGETRLTKALADALLGETMPSSESHMRFINLNQRSLVGGIATDSKGIDTSFLQRMVDGLYGGENAQEIWEPCQSCSARERCEVYRATRIFGPKELPNLEPQTVRERSRQRLFEALQAVHLRGETHITMRELRATLVYILFGTDYCSDYHANTEPKQLYSDRAFDPESPARQGEVLRDMARFDPALEAHPQIDRYLLQVPLNGGKSEIPHYGSLPLKSARRRAYFEWPEASLSELTRDPHALGLARGRNLQEFRNIATAREADRQKLVVRLCRGMSRLESLPPKALDRQDVVPLRITSRTPTETAFWVEKPIENFCLEADLPKDEAGLERLHRQAFLVYRYGDGRKESLRMGADLFHLLLEISDGYQLGDVSTDDAFAHLSIFVQRLVQEDHRQAIAWNPMREEMIYEVAAKLKPQVPVQRLVITPLPSENQHAR